MLAAEVVVYSPMEANNAFHAVNTTGCCNLLCFVLQAAPKKKAAAPKKAPKA